LLAARLGNSSEVHELAAAATGASVNTATRSHEELLLSLGEITLSLDSRDLAEAALEFIDRRKRNVLPSRAEANLLFRAGQLATRLGAFERANDYLTTALHFIGFNSVTP
jgi:hypothetical protein